MLQAVRRIRSEERELTGAAARCVVFASRFSVALAGFEMASTTAASSASAKAVMTVAALAALVSVASAQGPAPAPSNDGHLAAPSMLVGIACAACAFVYGRFL